jgi:CheY-like chemotaxis protein
MLATRSGPVPRILLVEDDPVFGEAVAKVLRSAGFDVCLVPDYRLALTDLASARPIDLMLADIVMPNMVNGIALSRMARLRRPNLKVVYMTAYDIPGAEDEALGPILRKPVDDDRLVSEVHRALAAG